MSVRGTMLHLFNTKQGELHMRRFTMPAALVFAGALALTGCASGGGDDTATAEESCSTIASQVRDISNGVQNNIAAPASVEGLCW